MSMLAEVQEKRGFLLNGRWVDKGETVVVRSPYDGQPVGRVVQGAREDALAAIAAAVGAFEVTRKLSSHERQHALKTVSDGIAARREEFARTIALEAGKPIKAARVEVDRAVYTFQLAAEESARIHGEYLPMDQLASTAGRWGMVRRFPVGPVATITPFNFPLNLPAHKIAPAMACGCSVVLKPAPQTPFSALLLAEVITASGWPGGGVNVLPLSNEDASELVTDDRIKLLSFTGSAAAGWTLKSRAGKKRVVLELGGNAGVIVHSDADTAYAAERCVTGGFSYAGQSCISVQRIYVQREILAAFQQALLDGVGNLKCGDPLDDSVDVGPLIRESDVARAEQWIREAVAGGAKLLCGGKRHGSMLEPTVLTGTRPDMKVSCQEIFAPVVLVEEYEDFADALQRVNDSSFGLQAGIFTRDAKLIFRAYDELEVGGVIAGDVPTFRIDHMPYGGIKDSGLGREGIRYAIEDMTERKVLVMNLR